MQKPTCSWRRFLLIFANTSDGIFHRNAGGTKPYTQQACSFFCRPIFCFLSL